jgi:hypothetical protein
MRKSIFLIIIFFVFQTKAQKIEEYIIVTVITENPKGLHKLKTSYWVMPLDDYKSAKDTFYLLYSDGFSKQDKQECCTENNLMLFNQNKKEDFDFSSEYLKSTTKFLHIIDTEKKKVQTIKKNWISGKKQKIRVYITPVRGAFCICNLENGKKIGFEGKVAILDSSISYFPDFWKSDLYLGFRNYDFSKLPIISLETIQ